MRLVKIRMLRHQQGQDVGLNGIALPEMLYLKGREYEVSETFAKVLCEELKAAELAIAKSDKNPSRENKDLGSPIEESKSNISKKKTRRRVLK